MSKKPIVTRTESGKRVAFLEQGRSKETPRGEYVPRGKDVKRIEVMSQTEYDAIASPDDYTLYLIEE